MADSSGKSWVGLKVDGWVDQKVVSKAVLWGCQLVVRKVDRSAVLLGFRLVERMVAW